MLWLDASKKCNGLHNIHAQFLMVRSNCLFFNAVAVQIRFRPLQSAIEQPSVSLSEYVHQSNSHSHEVSHMTQEDDADQASQQ